MKSCIVGYPIKYASSSVPAFSLLGQQVQS